MSLYNQDPATASIDEKASFNGPAMMHSFDGILFDMDGTIIDSTAAIVKHWSQSVESILLRSMKRAHDII